MVKRQVFFFFCVLVSLAGFTQPGQLTDVAWADTGRIRQLLNGKEEHDLSYTIRPLNGYQKNFKRNSKFSASRINAIITFHNNSSLPYSYNEGSLYPAVGLQERISIGVTFLYKHWSLKLQPELVAATNKSPEGLAMDFDQQNYWPRYYEYVLNKIDLPDYFGDKALQKFYPGQSSVKYNTEHLSVGISTENLWWGPGLRNSLIMTNSAPGFMHFTVNTRKPWQTRIGAFEGQWIVGQLNDSKIDPPENTRLNNAAYFIPRNTNTRTITGLVLSWQPKWTPNLYIGFAKSYYLYNKDVVAKDLLPFGRINEKRPGLGSLFIRYAMPADHAEVYVEYGRSDKPATLVNIFEDTIPSAYVIGLRKLFPLRSGKSAIEFLLELAHLQLPNAHSIFQNDPALNAQTKSWYLNRYIRQGYTQDGRSLGASIGAGSNSQTMSVSWLKGMSRVGFSLERVLHNNDFYYYNYFNGLLYPGPNFKYWTDLSAALQFQWQFKKLIIAGNLQYTSALNYKWVKLGSGGIWAASDITDKKNYQSSLSVFYKL